MKTTITILSFLIFSIIISAQEKAKNNSTERHFIETEARDKIPDLLPMLKSIREKELQF